MRAFFIATGGIEIGAGLALLVLPSLAAIILLGTTLETPAALTVARVGGAGLLGLGVACWLARNDSQSLAGRGLVAAMLIYNFGAVAALVYASIGFGLHGVLLWPAVILHGAMGAWSLGSLRHKVMNGRLDNSWLK